MKLFSGGVSFILVLLASYSGFYFFGGSSEMEKKVEEDAIALISEQQNIDKSDLSLEEMTYSEDALSYAVLLNNKSNSEDYAVAAILSEDESEISMLIDVTGTYDDYGLAYCH
ncbi:hypothetical protein [Salipaludibacillus sp. CF4.18]|uniref:hypothetical protein n=1 Tax=Salipaludibacillus sp. CF4.18 TaxID=3373081 RepID=UPI003EE7A20D